MEKDVVVIGRKWNNPSISMTVNINGIEIVASLDDFVVALAQEVGNPMKLMTRAAMLKTLREASDTVVRGLKEETKHII
jgi:hypothetical protein